MPVNLEMPLAFWDSSVLPPALPPHLMKP